MRPFYQWGVRKRGLEETCVVLALLLVAVGVFLSPEAARMLLRIYVWSLIGAVLLLHDSLRMTEATLRELLEHLKLIEPGGEIPRYLIKQAE